MSTDNGETRQQQGFEAGHQRRLKEFDQRLGAGEFELGLELSELTGEEGVEQHRQAFAFAAWAARVLRDPVEDFDGFVECLWESVEVLFQLGERIGANDADLAGLPEAMGCAEEPWMVVWGDE